MDRRDDLKEQILKATENIEIPKELEPEAVERMLREHAEKAGGETENTRAGNGENAGKSGGSAQAKRNRGWRRYARIYGGAAATVAVVLLAMAGIGRLDRSANSTQDMAAAETAEESTEVMEEIFDEALPEEEPIRRAESYEEIYALLDEYEQSLDILRGPMLESSAADGAAAAGAADSVSGSDEAGGSAKLESAVQDLSGSDYSQTNVRERGVDEADIVKTDGTYIYTAAASSGKVQIVRAGDLVLCTEVEAENGGYISEIYVENDRLTILSEGGRNELLEDADGLYYSDYQTEVTAAVYDISDPEHPRKAGSVSQEGSYRTSRKVGGYLYLFTDCWKNAKDQTTETSYIPSVNGMLLKQDCIYLPEGASSGHYILISAVDLNDPSTVTDSKGVLCDGAQYYVSKQHIYILQTQYGTTEETEIFKFRFYNGQIWARGVGLVPGSVEDSFCIDEYNGNLRVVTTKWSGSETVSGLYILDAELETVGSIEDIAPGETVQSARLMGDTGYFVTFRQMDPLFCVDLSDPSDPEILGELKVSGFSSYLHPYGEGRLLGMGQEAKESTGEFVGYKLSMFDVSEAGKMEELDKVVFRNVDLVGLWNYKSVLADEEKNIIGVCLEKWTSGKSVQTYQVYAFDEEAGFVKLLDYQLKNENGSLDANGVRGLYIGEMLYVTSPEEITVFAMNQEYKQTGSLSLR